MFFLALAFILMPNIYFIANKLGITLAPGWYQNMVDWVTSGGTIAGAFAAIAGITVPAWLSAVVAGFGLEASLVSTVVFLLFLLILFNLPKKNNRKPPCKLLIRTNLS